MLKWFPHGARADLKLAAGPRPALQESLQCPKCCSGKLLCCRKWLSSELTVGSLAAFRGLQAQIIHNNFHLTHITLLMAETPPGRDQTKETGLSDGAITSKGCARFWQSIAQFWLCRLHHPDTHGYVWALITACPVHINYDPLSLQCPCRILDIEQTPHCSQKPSVMV